MKHYIITYSAARAAKGHIDPNFTQIVYGNNKNFGVTLKNNIEPGSYIFFNARIGNKRYITAYFYIEKVLEKGKHDFEIDTLTCSAKDDDVIFIGNRSFSKILTTPLVLDKSLMAAIESFGAADAYFKMKESSGCSELEAIKDKTLHPHIITEEEKEMLIGLCKDKG